MRQIDADIVTYQIAKVYEKYKDEDDPISKTVASTLELVTHIIAHTPTIKEENTNG